MAALTGAGRGAVGKRVHRSDYAAQGKRQFRYAWAWDFADKPPTPPQQQPQPAPTPLPPPVTRPFTMAISVMGGPDLLGGAQQTGGTIIVTGGGNPVGSGDGGTIIVAL